MEDLPTERLSLWMATIGALRRDFAVPKRTSDVADDATECPEWYTVREIHRCAGYVIDA